MKRSVLRKKMKKKASILLLICSLACRAGATEQIPDIIVYREVQCELQTHWGYPSPLDLYFSKDVSRKSPFESTSTANYRGHVATWEVSGKRLYLVKIEGDALPLHKREDKPEPQDSRKRESSALLRQIFPDVIRADGRVLADWYTGTLQIHGKPVKRRYQAPDGGGFYQLNEHTEISLLDFKKGILTRETNFSAQEYWRKLSTFRRFCQMPEAETEAFRSYARFVSTFRESVDEDRDTVPDAPLRTEDDFSIFLTRYVTRPVRIPLTECVIVGDAFTDLSDPSWFSGPDLRVREGYNLLVLEMGSTNVPKGPWSGHTDGAVQVVVQLGELARKSLRFNESDTNTVKVINHFRGSREPGVTGSLKVDVGRRGKVYLTGAIRLTSKQSSTAQEILLEKNEVPISSIKDFIWNYCDDRSFPGLDPVSMYRGVQERSRRKE